MTTESRRALSRFLTIAEPAMDAAGLVAICLYFLQFIPTTALSSGPATGGDTGSHFWPLVTLVEHALPSAALRAWNPGNLGGEPHLVHYFPFPYLVMALLSVVAPLGAAFNLGTLLPLLTLPLAVYFGLRLMGLRFPAPILGAVCSTCFLYNESFSMWGGNTLSTLAGQFAHVYALNFLMLGAGLAVWELRRKRFPLFSALAFAALNLSHAYVMVGLPFVFLSLWLFRGVRPCGSDLIRLIGSGVMALLFSAWFLIPMLDNAKWTTAYFFDWISPKLLQEIFPPIFYPLLGVIILCLALLPFYRRAAWRSRVLQSTFFWGLPSLAYVGYYFVFPLIGLVDVRAFPQVELFLCVLAGVLAGLILRLRRTVALFATFPVVCLVLFWVDLHVRSFPEWLKWNYAGWSTKPAYPALQQMYAHLRGNFSQPRVIYEHNTANGEAGTERVFEMLPYFTGRATMESVYLQASILAPAAFMLQSAVSKAPSCPFSQFECIPYNLPGEEPVLRLLGVGEIILRTPELLAQAEQAPYLSQDGTFGSWTLYRMKEQPPLVELMQTRPRLSSDSYWKGRYDRRADRSEQAVGLQRVPVNPARWPELFYAWLRNYTPGVPMVVVDRGDGNDFVRKIGEESPRVPWPTPLHCRPTLKVEVNKLHLSTSCPGFPHYLKFAFHDSWRADSGDDLFLVSPGFIGIVPSKSEVTLDFGQSRLWRMAGILSVLSLLGACVWILYGPRLSRVALF